MRKKAKRLFRRLFKVGGLFIIIGLAVLLGIAIGSESAGDRQTVIIRSDNPNQFADRVTAIEHQVEERIEQRIEEQIVIPPIPEMPDLPTTIYINSSPSFGEVVNGISTVLASLGLIALGVVTLIRQRRPKEKSPASLSK